MLSLHYIITFWQWEGFRKWNKMVPKSQQYMMRVLNTYLHFLFKKIAGKYSGEGSLSEKVHFARNRVTKLLFLPER